MDVQVCEYPGCAREGIYVMHARPAYGSRVTLIVCEHHYDRRAEL